MNDLNYPTRSIVIDGNNFQTLEEFYEEVSLKLVPGYEWGHNLDAFNDILRGGFGTPEEGFEIIWKNSHRSKVVLGYEETVRQLEKRLEKCHETARSEIRSQLSKARESKGTTVFDWLVEIINDHGPGGQESEDNVRLKLN